MEELLRRVEGDKESGDGNPIRDVISKLMYVASTSSNFRHRDDQGAWQGTVGSVDSDLGVDALLTCSVQSDLGEGSARLRVGMTSGAGEPQDSAGAIVQGCR
jgi:hypothetical protein